MPCCLCLPFRLHYTTNTVQIGQVPSFFLSSWTLRFSISRLNDFEYSRGRVKEAALGKFCCSGKLNPIQQNLWSTAFELLLTFNLKLAEKLPEMRKLPKARYFHRIFAVRVQEMSRVKIIISNTSSPFFLAGSIIKIFWSIELNHMIMITILSNSTNDDFVMMMTSLIINVNGHRAISWPFRRIAPWSDAHTMLLFVVIIIINVIITIIWRKTILLFVVILINVIIIITIIISTPRLWKPCNRSPGPPKIAPDSTELGG